MPNTDAQLEVIRERDSFMSGLHGAQDRHTLLGMVDELNKALEESKPAVDTKPHKLTWNGTEWVAPCGCAYHPDDDNFHHGGAPHIHLCTKHNTKEEDETN